MNGDVTRMVESLPGGSRGGGSSGRVQSERQVPPAAIRCAYAPAGPDAPGGCVPSGLALRPSAGFLSGGSLCPPAQPSPVMSGRLGPASKPDEKCQDSSQSGPLKISSAPPRVAPVSTGTNAQKHKAGGSPDRDSRTCISVSYLLYV